MGRKKILLLFLVVTIFVMAMGCSQNSSQVNNNSDVNDDSQESDNVDVNGNSSENNQEEEKEIQTFTLFLGDNTKLVHDDLFSTTIGQMITEKTGVKLDIEYLIGGTVQQKVGIMIASGDLPDFVDGHEAHQSFIDAGVLVPLDDYIEEYGDNTKELYGDVLNQMQRSDGHIYDLSPYRETIPIEYPQGAMWIQAKVLEEYDWPMITQLSDYVDIISDYVANHPETDDGLSTIGFSVISETWRAFTYTNAPGIVCGSPNHGWFVVDENDQSVFFPTMEIGEEYYKQLNSLWNGGLMDTEAFTQSYDQYISKLITGRVVVSMMNTGNFLKHKRQF